MTSNATRFLVIHAHFYQPPRENPWTGVITREESAAPYHDWNERILHECYRPNSASRILDGRKRVLQIANNYRRISFNFGPTLAAWLEERDPEVYQRVIEADHASIELNNGHGNAIAQAYNHMILPLANERDVRTQIRWGIADFRHRFGREPEAMWLPETAVNRHVLQELIDHGMKYVILSPYQAKRIRRLDSRTRWTDVSGGRVDTSRPYRWRPSPKEAPDGRGIDVLFYDGSLSHRVSFENLLANAGNFAEAILESFSGSTKRDQLVLIATDGETYGHHKPFGDMALAYLLEMELPKTDVVVTNPGAYLEGCRPQWEVEIDEGPDGLGSSWSCAHGVGRWYRDCGCSTGGQPGWHQRWRQPLREALDLVRDRLAEIFEQWGERVFEDPWRARDAYIEVVLDRSPENVQRFLEQHCPRALTGEARVQALTLLEMQRHAMLMYTSCGWFFAEISGLETRQVLSYAARALELAAHFGIGNLEDDFLSVLEKAPSNVPNIGNGRIVFEKLVRPTAVGFDRVVHQYAVRTLHSATEDKQTIYRFEVEPLELNRSEKDGQLLLFGTVRVTDGYTFGTSTLHFAELYRGGLDFRCRVVPQREGDLWERARAELQTLLDDPESSEERLVDILGGPTLRLVHLFEEEREKVIQGLLAERLRKIEDMNEKVFQENEDLIEDLAECRYRLPQELAAATTTALGRRIVAVLEKSLPRLDSGTAARVHYWYDLGRTLGVRPSLERARSLIEEALQELTAQLESQWRTESCVHIVRLLETARRLELGLNETFLQDWYWQSLWPRIESIVVEVAEGHALRSKYVLAAALLRLGRVLNFNVDAFKERLRPVEEKLSQDPAYWP